MLTPVIASISFKISKKSFGYNKSINLVLASCSAEFYPFDFCIILLFNIIIIYKTIIFFQYTHNKHKCRNMPYPSTEWCFFLTQWLVMPNLNHFPNMTATATLVKTDVIRPIYRIYL